MTLNTFGTIVSLANSGLTIIPTVTLHYFLFFSYRSEVWIILKKSFLLSIVECFSLVSGPSATFFTIFALILTGHTISPPTAFTVLAFMSVLRSSVSVVLASVFEIFVSLKRIQTFLLQDNMPLDPLEYSQASLGHEHILKSPKLYPKVSVRESIMMDAVRSSSITYGLHQDAKQYEFLGKTNFSVSNLTCKLNGSDNKHLLQEVSFEASETSLTVITGQVGSGKSTLLAAIAGEVIPSSGNIVCSGTIAYVSQTAWVFSGTLRENVLFGEPYDEKKYAEVIKACALTEDINRFSNGDLSMVGERGVVLSGGQRARVNLARAVYADADVYLLDDPLSAVDAKVSEHIFYECICKLLQEKIKILITYAEKHMKAADQIVFLHKGSVLGKGSFDELQDDRNFLHTIIDASQPYNKERKTSTTVDDSVKLHSFFEPFSGGSEEHLEIAEEDKATGKISSALYWNYLRAGANPVAIIFLVVFFLATQGEFRLVHTKMQLPLRSNAERKREEGKIRMRSRRPFPSRRKRRCVCIQFSLALP